MPRKKKVVITECEYSSVERERDIVTGAGFELAACQANTRERLLEVTRDADALLVQYADIDKQVIDHLERCRVIVRYGVGVNNIDLYAATEKGIFVCNVPDYGLDEVSNQAVAMLMSLARKLPQVTKAVRDGNWGYRSAVPIHRFADATLGVVGCGRIGGMFIRKMRGFGIRILASDPYAGEEAIREAGAIPADFDTVLRESDYISLHLPLHSGTCGLFDKSVFARMKPGAVLVNTSRGPIVHRGDLVQALQSGKLAGAGLDVFEPEPIGADDELLRFDNVIATPHIAWYSEQAIVLLQEKTAAEAVNVLRGNPPFHLQNREVLRRAGGMA